MREHLVEVNVTARTRDLARDACFRSKERLIDFFARAVREQHWRDRMAELRDRRAQEETPTGSGE
jgi:hypothetical protein